MANLKIDGIRGEKREMDLATLIGLILGIAIIGVSLLVGGVPIQLLLQPQALLIVFGGAFTALLINFSLSDIQNAVASLSKAFQEDPTTPEEISDTLTDAAVYIRSKGLLAVQPLLSHVDIPFLQKGLQMVVDNQPTEFIRSQLTTELEVQYRRDYQYAKVFEVAGGLTPTMGIIGAVVGLIEVMNLMHTPDLLGNGIAKAFVATLYGVGAANIFFLPIGGKLKERAKNDWFLKSMMLQGLLAIREGQHPLMIQEQLNAYVDSNKAESQDNIPDIAYQTPVSV